ncbi:MAG TPA: hypothetical protein VKF63_04830 [Terracidiphilus sp.]|nr:hypothetical protein [Terracidiphilus sp.]
MKQRALLTILICATALAVVPEQPRASAQETLTLWRYQPGTSGTRQPRTGSGGLFVIFSGPSVVGGALTPGATIPVQTTMPSPYPSPNPAIQYVLAYVSISGGANGDITVFPDSAGIMPLTENVTLPNTPNPKIAVNAYYTPEGGGPCPPGKVCGTAYIDQFDEVLGSLESDTFVNVLTTLPPTASPALTQTGNVDGYVSTGTSAVQIDAIQTTTAGRIFDRWSSGPGGTINGNNLGVGKGVTLYKLALYHSQCPGGSTWSSGATVSQCTPPPSCPDGEIWNVTTKKCVVIKNPGGDHCNMKCPPGTRCVAVAYECDCICQGPQPGNRPPAQ